MAVGLERKKSTIQSSQIDPSSLITQDKEESGIITGHLVDSSALGDVL